MPAGVDFVLNVEIRKLGFSWLEDLFETRAGTGTQPNSKAKARRKATTQAKISARLRAFLQARAKLFHYPMQAQARCPKQLLPGRI